jgi:murein DD-endopeptidase MepM/ murein hydrolase activator NlpD
MYSTLFHLSQFKILRVVYKIVLFLIIYIGLHASGIFPSTQSIYAQSQATAGIATPTSAEELRRKIEEQNRNIEALNKEIQSYAALKDKTTKEAQTLQAVIKELERNTKMLDLDVKKTRSQIQSASLEINKLNLDIKTSEQKIDSYIDVVAQGLREVQYIEDTETIVSVLSERTLSEVLNQIQHQTSLNEFISKEVASLQTEKQQLKSTKESKEKKKIELSEFQKALDDKKKVVEYNKSEQGKVLSTTKNKEQEYQKLLAEKQAAKAAFEKDLFAYESALKYTLDQSSIPRAGSSVLAWPLDSVRITQYFGKTVAAKRLYVSGSHNGMDFGASIGTPVKSVLSGTVIGAGDTDVTCPRASFGRWILVRHNNGLASIYAHLSVISVKEGDTVTTEQVIGYSGNTGYSTGPHLHLGVYAADAVKVENRPSVSCGGKIYRMPIAPTEAYLDPVVYLPKL